MRVSSPVTPMVRDVPSGRGSAAIGLLAFAFLAGACGDDTASGTGGGGSSADGATTAATGATTVATGSSGTGDGSGGGGGSEPVFDECAPPTESACTDAEGNPIPGGMIRGIAKLGAGMNVPAGTTGDLIIGLMHGRLGEEEVGGHPHWYEKIAGVDLSAGEVPFEIDMCGGGTAMWSEDNCEYNLVVMLDTNDNAGVRGNRLLVQPDADEVGWHELFNLSCRGESPCMDVTFDCLGPDCVTFEPLGQCQCAAETCDSDDVSCRE